MWIKTIAEDMENLKEAYFGTKSQLYIKLKEPTKQNRYLLKKSY